MNTQRIVIIGLPESGKTTFLAALWHLVTTRDVKTRLRFDGLSDGDAKHLNAIATRWREAKVQDRTALGGSRLVSINLRTEADASVQVTFPDVPGEAYRRMWEDRECDSVAAEYLAGGGVLFFVHSDTIRAPVWVVDEVALSRAAGLEVQNATTVPWHPRLSPTQVQIVDMLQLLRAAPLDSGPRRLTIMLSAWDKVEAEGLAPAAFIDARMPLLAQYLRRNADAWTYEVCGVSAQGGDYDSVVPGAPSRAGAETLRRLDQPSKRIRLISVRGESHDLTEPLAWLMA